MVQRIEFAASVRNMFVTTRNCGIITPSTENCVPLIQKPHDHAGDVASRRLAAGWNGHLPVTHIALLSLLSRAAAGHREFSRVERLLCVACEFWAAVNARELDAYLDSHASDRLRDARFAFSEIGAEHVVQAMHQSALDVAGPRSIGERGELIAEFEERLLRAPDPVDMLIARFAWRYFKDRRRTAEPVSGSLERRLSYG
jgi:hypothetical protein